MKKRAFFRAVREIHAWSGALLSLLLLVLSVSGTLLVFKTEYLKLVLPEARAEADLSPAALSSIMAQAEDTFGEDLTAVTFADERFGLHRAWLAHGGGAYLDGNGELVSSWEKNGRAEEWLFDLHHHLLAGHTGEVVAGVTAAGTVILAIGGLVAFWPMRRGWRRGLKADSTARQELRSLHRNLGIIAAAPTLLVTLTGAMMVFPGAAKSVLGGAEPPAPSVVAAEVSAASAAGLIDALPDEGFGPVRIAVPAREGRGPVLRVRQPGEWHPNGRSVLSVEDGVLLFRDAEAFPLGERIYNSAYPLHAGKAGGFPARALLFAGGVGLCLLAASGLWSFLKRSGLFAVFTRLPARAAG